MSNSRPERKPAGFSPNTQPPIGSKPAGSPLPDISGARMYTKSRAREIQAQEGHPANPWGGPPTSGNSTPLRENIPESPTDGFPDLAPLPTTESMPQNQLSRARAGTLPSVFPPSSKNGNAGTMGISVMAPNPSIYSIPVDASGKPRLRTPKEPRTAGPEMPTTYALVSRLRAGSMPQVPRLPSVYGGGAQQQQPQPYGLARSSRDRGSTLQSIASQPSDDLSSPTEGGFSHESAGDNDSHVRTLDYLGLAETPQQPRAQLAMPYPTDFDEHARANRLRSYSVNHTDKYAGEDGSTGYADAEEMVQYDAADYTQLQNHLLATQAAIHNHNMAVHAFTTQMTRPRARTTTGVFDPRVLHLTSGGVVGMSSPLAQVESSQVANDVAYAEDLGRHVANMSLHRSNSHNNNNNNNNNNNGALLLSPDDTSLEGPTSALWLGSIPTSTTISTLTEIFKTFGTISSVRVLTHKSCGFVNFDRIESAVAARLSLNNKEIFPGAGPVRINFAKPPSASNTPGPDGIFPSPSPDPNYKGQEVALHQTAVSAVPAGDATTTTTITGSNVPLLAHAANAPPPVVPISGNVDELMDIIEQLGASDEEKSSISECVDSSVAYIDFIDEIPPIHEPAHVRVYDAPRLREIRKRIDNQNLSQSEIESVATDMLPEIAELSSDYLGNTVVQKLFEYCSDTTRDAMLAKIAPHMAEIGVHKNGTWAAQKIIDVCRTPEQMRLIVEHLRPYTVPLFLDQYGNYVLQGCLKFGSPFNNFIFETMLSRMWEIAQGRFGARAMRACLESHHATKNQLRMLAAGIALHGVQLSTNTNGALLLTWFLDTCTFPQRRTVLAPLLVPYLVHLCTHKVAYLTVLKVINQKTEPEARDLVLKALFFEPSDLALEAILRDNACGATMIYKIITTPISDGGMHARIVDTVKSVLLRINAHPNQGYKRLMDEVGLPTRHNANNDGGHGNNIRVGHGGGGEPRHRPSSRSRHNNSGTPNTSGNNRGNSSSNNTHSDNGNSSPLYSNAIAAGYDVSYNSPRHDALGDPGMTPFHQSYSGHQTPLYHSSPGTPVMTAATLPGYHQFQTPIINRAPQPVNAFYTPLPVGFGGFTSPINPLGDFRAQNPNTGSPALDSNPQMGAPGPHMIPGNVNMGFVPPPNFALQAMNVNMSGFPYGVVASPAQNMAFVQQQQQQQLHQQQQQQSPTPQQIPQLSPLPPLTDWRSRVGNPSSYHG